MKGWCLLVCVNMPICMVQVASACALNTYLEYHGIFSQIRIFSHYGIPKSQKNSNSSFSSERSINDYRCEVMLLTDCIIHRLLCMGR